jgi:serine/threonine protein kinase
MVCFLHASFYPLPTLFCSSAKDQLTGASVAIKKIMKPFSTPVLSKRTYRELKLLKHIQHENVRPALYLLLLFMFTLP